MANEPTQYELETETHINWDKTGHPARLETFDPSIAKRWARAGVELKESPEGRWTGEVPIRNVVIRRPRVLTDEQKQIRAQRFRESLSKRKT